MTGHSIFIVIVLFVLTACSNKSEDKSKEEIITLDSSAINSQQAETFVKPTIHKDKLITDRLLNFAKFLDSIGYSWDTTRLKKVAVYSKLDIKPMFVDHLAFFEVPFRKTTVYLERNNEDMNNSFIDTNEYGKAKKIIMYYFREKNPSTADWITDGVIEEWDFPDSTIAKKISEDLDKIQKRLFWNREAFICRKDNYVYLCYSRSSGFMYAIKPFFDWFATVNKVKRIGTKWY